MTHPFTNRLIKEKSPYLLQHAHNPVDWYPWGKEAFDEARSQDKPIFLSIGYATCHWCHVMETESFEDPELARMLNETFVNIKVDREELPEVDSVYMDFAQALMASAGGWPLNVILTPDQKPFFAITYLPPKTRKGLMGLDQFVHHIQKLWRSEERTHLTEQADKIVELFARSLLNMGTEMPTEEHVTLGVHTVFENADPIYGGPRGEPKFPMGYLAIFLLQFTKQRKESRSLFYLELTLDKMCLGGIYDHVGGGFCRYSVDDRWMIPHFEKMLYDNAILARAYLEAWKYTKKTIYKDVCEDTLRYLLRDMQGSSGGFYTAEDADIEGHEGLFYTWTQEDIFSVLPEGDAEIFCQYFGVRAQGNFEGRCVLYALLTPEEYAEAIGIQTQALQEILAQGKKLLFQKREQKKRPFKDDKIITSWNGFAIDSLIHAALAFQNDEYKDAAIRAAHFIKDNLWKEGILLHRFRDGEARFHAGLDDYAFLIKGVLSLFQQGCGTNWLEWAIEMTDVVESTFKSINGAFYQADIQETLPIRKCEFYDGSEPSGNAVHAENCLRLYQITRRESYLKQTEDVLKAVKNYMEAYPLGACYHLSVLQRYLDKKAPTVVIALDAQESLRKEISAALGHVFSSHLEILWKHPSDTHLVDMLPHLADKVAIDGKTTVYICFQDTCLPPMQGQEAIIRALEDL